MKAFLFFLLIGLATSANAQTVMVRSGSHDGYIRLVFSFPQLVDWTLSREQDGYSLMIAGQTPTYELGDVYRRIATDRLSQIFWESQSTVLKLKVACSCYAIPFVLRDGILVIDIKDGAPPPGSSFERAADGGLLPPLSAPGLMQPKSRPENLAGLSPPSQAAPPTLSGAILQASRLSVTVDLMEIVEASSALDQVKEDLRWQLSKGVADGVVEVSKPFERIEAQSNQRFAPNNLRIGAEVGVVPDTRKRKVNQMTGAGAACIPDDALDITTWGGQIDGVSGIAPATTGLVGEFDRPDPEAISRSVRYLLSLGFGSEARQVLTAFNVALPDRAMWETLSHIVDLEVPPGDVFSNMEVCDTSAALWSLLSVAEMPPPNKVAIPAVLRSFSSLPLHLRRLLGPDLATRFLLRNDATTARAIRDSILRAPGQSGARVQMLEAELALANGNTTLAAEILSPLSGGSGPLNLRSTVALIETQVDAGHEVSQNLVTTAESLLLEARGGADEALLAAALGLGYAAQNRFEEAFDLVTSNNLDSRPIWDVLADRGNDSDVLRWAILDNAEKPPALTTNSTAKIGRHLLDLGFPDDALKWIEAKGEDWKGWDESFRLLAAEAALSRNDLSQALAYLEEMPGEAATRLRGNVLAGMRSSNAVGYLSQSGQAAEAASLARQTRNWSGLRDLDQGGVWQEAAALIQPRAEAISTAAGLSSPPEAMSGALEPLAQTRAVLEASAATRAILDQLLADQSTPQLRN